MMLLLQAGVIGQLFGSQSMDERQLDQFIRTGNADGVVAEKPREPHHPLVDEIIARTLATGKLVVE